MARPCMHWYAEAQEKVCKAQRDEARASTDSSAHSPPVSTGEASVWMRKVGKLIGET